MALLTQQSEKLLRLALNPAAHDGEWRAAAVKFISALRENSTAPEDVIANCQVKAPRTYPAFFMPFGQHKGVSLSKIPTEYLLWVVEKITNRPDLIAAAKRELEERA